MLLKSWETFLCSLATALGSKKRSSYMTEILSSPRNVCMLKQLKASIRIITNYPTSAYIVGSEFRPARIKFRLLTIEWLPWCSSRSCRTPWEVRIGRVLLGLWNTFRRNQAIDDTSLTLHREKEVLSLFSSRRLQLLLNPWYVGLQGGLLALQQCGGTALRVFPY